MKQISKIVITLLIVSFIVPQVALASWWNPLSWNIWGGIFHKTDSKTQILENRVKELENKLNSQPTSTTTKTDNTKQSVITKQTEPKSENNINKPTTETTKTTNNTQATTMKLSVYNSYIDSAIKAYQENITNYNQMASYIQGTKDGLDREESLLLELKASETDSWWKGAWQLVIDKAVVPPRERCNQFLDNFNKNIQAINSNIAILRNEKDKNNVSAPVSIEQYIAYFDKLNSLIIIDKFSQDVDSTSLLLEPFNQKTFVDLKGAVKIFADKQTELYYKSIGTAYVPSQNTYNQINNYYVPPVFPTIQVPQTTHCTMMRTINGATMDCY